MDVVIAGEEGTKYRAIRVVPRVLILYCVLVLF